MLLLYIFILILNFFLLHFRSLLNIKTNNGLLLVKRCSLRIEVGHAINGHKALLAICLQKNGYSNRRMFGKEKHPLIQ